MGWLTSTRPMIHFPKDALHLRICKANAETEKVTLQGVIETRCKSLFTPYRPAWWLFNSGHLQTIFCSRGDFSKIDQVWYFRQHLSLLDGGTLGLDFLPHDSYSSDDDTPIIVVQHGLTGGSHEAYIRAILAPACAPVSAGGLGYRAVVVNFRGCSGVPITSPKFYTAAHTADLRQALMYLAHKYPRAPLLGLGFSVGANIMVRYLAEQGSNSLLSSACVVACPWDLAHSTVKMLGTFMGKYLYLRRMGSNVRALIRHHYRALALVKPEHPVAAAVHRFLAVKNPTIADFDDTFTRFVGGIEPEFPFDSVLSYYSWASSRSLVQDVEVPFLAINAADDPVVCYAPWNDGSNKHVVTVVTAKGGHLGWFETSEKRWITQPVLEWLRLVGEDLELPHNQLVTYTDSHGCIRSQEREELGCKMVGKQGIIDGNRPRNEMFQGL
ncbi:AB-hydrolase YheT [Roridomyces roridus]|uniref:AB-hydrolase YheT n=1 Tax=Roridomyces roridus TaxID=1738132 RepID=A0AAD7CJ34_9AGAR|nr:AB-hydrolase YheT [Roridomyces roridus]